MPVTKREPHYGTPQNLIEYILDERNYGDKVGIASSINCNVETALLEFKDVQNKYQMKGRRVAYHIIQSFSPLDNITPEQANEIGKKLCKELYPDFQCVISTHIDKGHLHNHIALNAININGRKLEDRLANEKEGLYGLSDTSDKIAAEYGCFIMPRKTYLKSKKKNYYYQYKEQSYKEKIKEDINTLIDRCSNLDEFLEELSILGYEVRRGKNIAVKTIGMIKFARLGTIDEKFTEQNLYKHFRNQGNIKILALKTTKTEFNNRMYDKAQESKQAIELSQASTKGKVYTEYQKTKYQEVKRYYQLKKQLEYLEKYNIHSFDDIENEINYYRSLIKSYNVELKENKEEYEEIINKTEKAQDYIRLYEVHEYAMSYKEMDEKYVMPKEVEIFLDIQKELGINSVDDAKRFIKSTRAKRLEINQMKQKVLEMQRELNHLDTIKEEKLSNSGLFIHSIKFGGNRINYKKSNDDYFYINLPYTKEKMYIPKKYTAFNEKNQFYTLYLVDDMEYEIYGENDELIGNITGTELETYVQNNKKEIDKMYAN